MSARQAIVAVLLVSASGCAESTIIRTVPPGANVWVDGRSLGPSPARFVVSRSEWRDVFHCRLEKEGFHPRDCEIHGFVSGGRVSGGIFTVGISWLFKRPSTIEDEYEFALERDPAYRPSGP